MSLRNVSATERGDDPLTIDALPTLFIVNYHTTFSPRYANLDTFLTKA